MWPCGKLFPNYLYLNNMNLKCFSPVFRWHFLIFAFQLVHDWIPICREIMKKLCVLECPKCKYPFTHLQRFNKHKKGGLACERRHKQLLKTSAFSDRHAPTDSANSMDDDEPLQAYKGRKSIATYKFSHGDMSSSDDASSSDDPSSSDDTSSSSSLQTYLTERLELLPYPDTTSSVLNGGAPVN